MILLRLDERSFGVMVGLLYAVVFMLYYYYVGDRHLSFALHTSGGLPKASATLLALGLMVSRIEKLY